MMIILLILITLSLDSEWILLGESCCWSLLGLEGLSNLVKRFSSTVIGTDFKALILYDKYQDDLFHFQPVSFKYILRKRGFSGEDVIDNTLMLTF